MRASGILLHISSLPSPYGIGTLGQCAYDFVDFLAESRQSFWQMLPLNPTGYGDSPYQSFSVFAGNPYFIDLDMLIRQGLLEKSEIIAPDGDSVDYQFLYENRYKTLRAAYARFNTDISEFAAANGWLEDYAQFMAFKNHFGGLPWFEWDGGIKNRVPEAVEQLARLLAGEIGFYRFLQYEFCRQLDLLREYAHKKGVRLIGDIPIYVAADSADVWANSDLFRLDADKRPVDIAGCPPDAFSADGQLWGNPLYRWDVMKERGYKWWIKRVAHSMKVFDVLRIDHFRGFESYFAIPAGDTTAAAGRWEKGPGMDLFSAINSTLGPQSIIAEDLGYVSDAVIRLLSDTGYPGMKLLQFAFDSREQSDYLPHNYVRNSVVYTGTHDNDTVAGWVHSALPDDVKTAAEYLNIACEADFPWAFIRAAWASVSDMAIAPMQDFLCLGGEARMNTPSTLGKNWCWRMDSNALTGELAQKIAKMTRLYARA